ncbi:MAG: extracellular solute-binding protein [Bacilli bacterium]|jgi:spermidine/putrescine transport system substrate-binding protein|nr:MAG: Spermidine/putrescine-binding periplasmic protein precursor [Tenericutes bacterium ADurb.Bin024]
MKRKYVFLPLLLLGSVSLSSSPSPRVTHFAPHYAAPSTEPSGPQTLRIYNWEEYISEEDIDDPDCIDVLAAFQEYYLENYGEEVTIEYNTFSTNEDMYNIVKLNGAKYDLIAPSDYMIQRMIREDMLEKYDLDAEGNYKYVPNYNEYASPYLIDLFKEDLGIYEYAPGYMWGTMGFLYNSEFNDTINDDVQSWMMLWDKKYSKKTSIKDSMREGYLMGLFKYYEDELNDLAAQREAGLISDDYYNDEISDLLNDVDPDTIKEVIHVMNELKNNIYGLEVDQGKIDMITGKIAANTAWSGDAVYAIEEDPNDVLRYAIPKEGSNIWFDGWIMPKGANRVVAQRFVNFVSSPEMAIANMYYIGYTSFIAGDEVLEYVLDNDAVYEAAEAEETVELDFTYFFSDTIENPSDALITIDASYVGHTLTATYPTEEEIVRSVVMRDFGDSNKLVIDMWANFKATDIQNWMIIFSVIIVLAVGSAVTLNQVQKHKAARRKRNFYKDKQ